MNYEEISLFKGNGPLRISSKVRQWEGSYRDGNFYEPSLIVAFMNLLSRGGPFADESVFFLDIGANAGSYCLLPFYDDRLTCWCYEPHNEVYDILKENILLNNLEDRVHPFNIGLWETNTLKDFRIPIDKSDSGLSTLGNHTERFKYDEKEGIYKIETIECMSLDSHFKEMKPTSPVDAIKIDAEGAELFIFRGAENILKKDKPWLLLEYDEKNTAGFGYKPMDIQHYLFSIGYKFTAVVGETGGELYAQWEIPDEWRDGVPQGSRPENPMNSIKGIFV